MGETDEPKLLPDCGVGVDPFGNESFLTRTRTGPGEFGLLFRFRVLPAVLVSLRTSSFNALLRFLSWFSRILASSNSDSLPLRSS